MSIRTEDSRKRATHRSLVAAYLVVALCVTGLIASRWVQTATAVDSQSAAVSESQTAPEAAAKPAAPIRPALSQPLLPPPKIEPQPKPAPVAVSLSNLPPTSSTPAERAKPTHPVADAVTSVAAPVPAKVAPAPAKIEPEPVSREPELVLQSRTEEELKENLTEVAIKLDLHTGSPSLAQAGAQIKKITAEHAKFGARFDRRTQFLRQIRRDPSDVLPGEKQLVEEKTDRRLLST